MHFYNNALGFIPIPQEHSPTHSLKEMIVPMQLASTIIYTQKKVNYKETKWIFAYLFYFK